MLFQEIQMGFGINLQIIEQIFDNFLFGQNLIFGLFSSEIFFNKLDHYLLKLFTLLKIQKAILHHEKHLDDEKIAIWNGIWEPQLNLLQIISGAINQMGFKTSIILKNLQNGVS